MSGRKQHGRTARPWAVGFAVEPLVVLTGSEVLARAAEDQVAFIAGLAGHVGVTFVIELACTPDVVAPLQGRIRCRVLASAPKAATPYDLEEIADDLGDLLAARRSRFGIRVLTGDELAAAADPVGLDHVAEVGRLAEPLTIFPVAGSRPGFVAGPVVERPGLWSIRPFASRPDSLAGLAEVLLRQEHPVVVRLMLTPTRLTDAERTVLEEVAQSFYGVAGPTRPVASVRVLEALLFTQPLYEVRVVVASSAPLSHALLAALGHTVSPPPTELLDPVATQVGGYAIHRPRTADDVAALTRAFRAGDPTGDEQPLDRLRRLCGVREAAAVFRFPVADRAVFPGLAVDRVPSLAGPSMRSVDGGTPLGAVTADGGVWPLRIAHADRFRHTYVVGQTGTGKSTLLLSMVLDDIANGAGVGVIDPHGDLVEAVLARIPDERVDDVVLIDPGDPGMAVGLNLLEAEDPVQAGYLASDLCDFFTQMFDPQQQGIVGPRFHAWLRNAALLLMARPELGGSLLDIPRLFIDPVFRERFLAGLDPRWAIVLDDFWRGELAQTADFHRSEVLGWFRSKFEGFRLSPALRGIIGQPRSTVSIRRAMKERRIVLANLSKAKLGELDSAVLGFVVFAKVWAAALLSGTEPFEDRPEFFLYVDEFQSFTTSTLPTILSEARKFRLGLTVANQFVSQLHEPVREAVFGNVGNKLAFRVGPRDAELVTEWFADELTPVQLTQLPNFVAVASVLQDGEPSPPVAVRTASVADVAPGDEQAHRVRERSNAAWARPRTEVEADLVAHWQRPGPTFGPLSFLDEWLARRRRVVANGVLPDDGDNETGPIGVDDDLSFFGLGWLPPAERPIVRKVLNGRIVRAMLAAAQAALEQHGIEPDDEALVAQLNANRDKDVKMVLEARTELTRLAPRIRLAIESLPPLPTTVAPPADEPF